jgi:hypothetical protein
MARPNRKSAEFFYDTFADFSIEDQAAALKILEQVHRLAVRESKRVRVIDNGINDGLDLGQPEG